MQKAQNHERWFQFESKVKQDRAEAHPDTIVGSLQNLLASHNNYDSAESDL